MTPDPITMQPDHERVLSVLTGRNGAECEVVLRAGTTFRVHDVVYGYDDGDEVAHVTANIDATPSEGLELHLFSTSDVRRIVDLSNGDVLFEEADERRV